MINKSTISKFDIAGPRYTSYPTAPTWTAEVTAGIYQKKLEAYGRGSKTLSLYVHIPFCQSMCSFCACSVVIRQPDEKYSDEYLEHLFKEIDWVAQSIGKRANVKQLHLGGGTPNFFSTSQIDKLIAKLDQQFDIDRGGEVAVEIDPRTVSVDQIRLFKKLGFNRVSLGVQDFDEDVQKSVNRIQPFHQVKELVQLCRELKFHSINFDLIYGLPKQTNQSFRETMKGVLELKPDRIALYSFAYVPWLKKHQTKIEKDQMPTSDQKLDLFLLAREEFLKNGYQSIAMDHFALTSDEMAKAYNQNRLYRNFMGYTVKPADEYIGLGMSAIGYIEHTFVQNKKTLPEYYESIARNELPIERGKILNEDDQIRQWVIISLMCHFEIDKMKFFEKFKIDFDQYFVDELEHVFTCVTDGLVTFNQDFIRVTDLGKLFIRNVCMGFDYYLKQENAHKKFSQTV